jgi:hypothetical protein
MYVDWEDRREREKCNRKEKDEDGWTMHDKGWEPDRKGDRSVGRQVDEKTKQRRYYSREDPPEV